MRALLRPLLTIAVAIASLRALPVEIATAGNPLEYGLFPSAVAAVGILVNFT